MVLAIREEIDRARAGRSDAATNASKPCEHPPSGEKYLKAWVGTVAVETKPLHGIKRVPQCNHIGSTV